MIARRRAPISPLSAAPRLCAPAFKSVVERFSEDGCGSVGAARLVAQLVDHACGGEAGPADPRGEPHPSLPLAPLALSAGALAILFSPVRPSKAAQRRCRR